MKKLLFIFLVFLYACSSPKTGQVKTDNVVKKAPSTGWVDKDTYTVKVTASDLDSAIEKAKHKILEDIIRVRMINESRYTDITKISGEFDVPLKEGKVISRKNVSQGLEIFFQIRDKDLKKKFERK